MTFADTLSDHLSHMAQRCYGSIPDRSLRRNDSKALLSYRPASPDPFYIYVPAFLFGQKSNHEKVAEAQFHAKIREDVFALKNILAQGIPAFDSASMYFTLDVKTAAKSGTPRLRFEFYGHQFASNPVQLPTIVKKFDRLHRHLESVPRSDARRFKVGDRTYDARDAYDALRIHTALKTPDLIDTPPAVYPDVEITEVIDAKPLFQAIFAGN